MQETWRYPAESFGATESKTFKYYKSAALYFRDHRDRGRLNEFLGRQS